VGSDAKSAVRRYFDHEVAGYLDAYRDGQPGDSRRDVLQQRRDLALAMTPATAQRVLDIGAGPGVFTQRLLDRGSRCWVVDLSYEMVATASREVGDATGRVCFLVGDLDGLPFADGCLDAVICVGVLQYLPSLDFAFTELARVVAPGGQLVISFPNARSPLNVMHRLAIGGARRTRAVAERLGLVSRADPSRLTFRPDIPNRWLSVVDIERRAHAAGFATDQIVYHVLQFPFSVPGLGFAIRGWNQLVRGRLPGGRAAAWGREGIMRMTRSV
jgi:SAM-dependent methyltransferase